MPRKLRMVVFDLDGTLTPVDSLWHYLHQALGTWDRGRIAAQRYRSGKISYKEWAESDSQCWTGVPLLKVRNIIDAIPYQTGARELLKELKERGIKIVILSAGLSLLADRTARDLGADLAIANELRANDGHLTGEIDVKVAVSNKEQIVRQLASKLNISLREVALVGDRAMDLANRECLKIAFMPKDDLARREADYVIEESDLRAILQLLI